MLDPMSAAPAGVVHAVKALGAFAMLLNCVDRAKWDSLARPQPDGLAAIAFTLTGELESQIAEHMDLGAPPGS